MTTRGVMKARIRTELRVGTRFDADLDPAINAAIEEYRGERLWFAESRSVCAFNTVALQEFYTSADEEALGRLISIDYAVVTIGAQPYELKKARPLRGELRANGVTFGQPSSYTWYEESLRLYPIPADVFPIRIAGLFAVAPPATDEETGNPWMTHGELLIRSRAKGEIAQHRMRDKALAADMLGPELDGMGGAVGAALATLRRKTTSKTGTGYVVPYW